MDILRYTIVELTHHVAPGSGVDARTVDAAEAALGVSLPDDVRPLAAVFAGGTVGELQHFTWSGDDPSGIVAQTLRLRAAGLPKEFVAWGVADGHLLVQNVAPGKSYFLGISLKRPPTPAKPIDIDRAATTALFSYAGLLLEYAERARYASVRAATDERYRAYTQRSAKRWRHRWDAHEVETFRAVLKRGVRAVDRLGSVTHDGVYVDLRGAVQGVAAQPYIEPALRPTAPPPRPEFRAVDFSFADLTLWDADARDCLFRGAVIGCNGVRMERCDFTMAKVAGAFRQIMAGEFVECSFAGAFLAECALYGRFVRCDFSGADLWWAQNEHVGPPPDFKRTPAEFIDCTWTGCRFGGDARHWDAVRAAATATAAR